MLDKNKKYLMWTVMAIFVNSEGEDFARADYCLTPEGAEEKVKLYKEYVDTLKAIKIYGLDEKADIHLLYSMTPEKKSNAFDSMKIKKPNNLYVSLGDIVYINSGDEKTSGWFKKEYSKSKSVYKMEKNYDKFYETEFAASLIESNTKKDELPKITYIADIEDEGTLFDSFEELNKKFK